MSFKFLVQELPDQWPAPLFWVIETRVNGKVSFIKDFCFHLLGLRSIDRHIEDSKIQETNGGVGGDKFPSAKAGAGVTVKGYFSASC